MRDEPQKHSADECGQSPTISPDFRDEILRGLKHDRTRRIEGLAKLEKIIERIEHDPDAAELINLWVNR